MIQSPLRPHNPDVLTCIANLSNDEVFTPPTIANKMLDQVADAWRQNYDGADIWADPTVTFLDPCTKSGVFLREITRRFVDGLAGKIPNLQERVNHILTRQVFGLAITNLTALLSRRSVYCSKWANREHSICTEFDGESGHIWFDRTDHTWVGGTREARVNPRSGADEFIYKNRRCSFCGASEAEYARAEDLETHAYEFIHTDDVVARLNEIFGEEMHFDVVIGNPPYQLSDSGHGVSAKPIYHKFIEQAKNLDPKMLCMVVPARWFSGGKGLDAFRAEMLGDDRIAVLHDFPDSRDVFPEVDVAGGICYFLWSATHSGDTEITTHRGTSTTTSLRSLLEPGNDIFLRDERAIRILKKIYAKEMSVPFEDALTVLPESLQFAGQVSARKPFGFPTNFHGSTKKSSQKSVRLISKTGVQWVSRTEILNNLDTIDMWKVFTSNASNDHAGQPDKNGTRRVLGRTGILEPYTVVTVTYILLGTFDIPESAESCLCYVTTKFTRFLISLRTSTQHITRGRFRYVPIQKWDHMYTDTELYSKYNLDAREIELIENSIRPMDGGNDV